MALPKNAMKSTEELLNKKPAEELLEEMQKAKEKKEAPEPKEEAPAGYKKNPLFVEVKTARVQLALQPSTVKALKERCKAENISVNAFIEKLIKEALGEN